jgi:hypothetical protein
MLEAPASREMPRIDEQMLKDRKHYPTWTAKPSSKTP